jgi:predicted transcriptional regulator of viral defense system
MLGMARNTRRTVMALVGKGRLLRARELESSGIDRSELRRLTAAGVLERVTRGVYRLAGAPATEVHTVATVLKRVPQATVCLLTALQMHGLTTQLPHQVWIALDEKARRPRLTDLPVRVVRFSGAALTAGVESRKVEGVTVRVYGPAKTVADCFKYRNKIGLDIAIEALRDYRRWYPKRGEELREYARVCRVLSVMKPYLEAIV